MSTPQPQQQQQRERRPPTDFSKLETVTLSFKRPAKWYMYVVKSTLKDRPSVEIRARPSGAAQVVRVAEALKRLGYISYEKYYTTSVVEEDNLLRYIVVKVKKTENFDKLFKEREEERTKRIEAENKPQA